MNNKPFSLFFGDAVKEAPAVLGASAGLLSELAELRAKVALFERSVERLSYSGPVMPEGYCYLLAFNEVARETIARREGAAIPLVRWLELLRSSECVSQSPVSMRQHSSGLWHLVQGGARARRPEEWLAWWMSPRCPFSELADMTLGGTGGTEDTAAVHNDWFVPSYYAEVEPDEDHYYYSSEEDERERGIRMPVWSEPSMERVVYFCRMLSLISEAPASWCPHGVEMFDTESVLSCDGCMRCCMRMRLRPACVDVGVLFDPEEDEEPFVSDEADASEVVVAYDAAVEANKGVEDGTCWTLIAGVGDYAGRELPAVLSMRDVREACAGPDATRLYVVAPEPSAHEARPYHVRYPESDAELAVSVTARHIWTCMPDGELVGMQRRRLGRGGGQPQPPRAPMPVQQGFRGNCDLCGRFGHVARQCPGAAVVARNPGARLRGPLGGAFSEPVGRAAMRVERAPVMSSGGSARASGPVRGPSGQPQAPGRGGDVFSIRKSEVIVAQVRAPATGAPVLTSVPLLPGAFPWLGSVARNWSRYRFVSSVARFVSCQPTTSMGTVYLAYDYSRDLSGPAHDYAGLDATAVMNLERAVEASVWQTTPRPSTAYDARRRKDPWFSVSAAFEATDDDAVLVYGYQGSLPGGTVLGSIEIEYHVELVQPTVQRAPVAANPLTLDEALAAAYTAVQIDRNTPGSGVPLREGDTQERVFGVAQLYTVITDAVFSPDVLFPAGTALKDFVQPLLGNLYDLSQRDKLHLDWNTRGGHSDMARKFSDLTRAHRELSYRLATLESEGGLDEDRPESFLETVATAVGERIIGKSGGVFGDYGGSKSKDKNK